MTTRFIGSGRQREGGRSAVYTQDFHAHYSGGDFRHFGNQIDISPPITIYNNEFNGATVQETLEKMALFLSQTGQGYIAIGDGYDTGDYNAPPLDTAFTDAFANPRLVNGGVILVKAGTYRLNNTVTVPPGMTIMGEPRGTYIFGAMNESPMFHVEKSVKQFKLGELGGNNLYASDTTDQTKFYNIILGDNTDGYYELAGDPVATMTTVPFIEAEDGSNILLEKVVFLGRLDDSGLPLSCSHRAISYTGSAPSKPTTLEVQHCFFDGLRSAIEFTPVEGRIDTLRVEKCRAYLLGDSTFSDVKDNCFVSFNLCNAHFEGNTHYGISPFDYQDRCFALLSTAVVDPDVRVNIINNSGGPTAAIIYSTDELSNFFTNDNTTQTFECVNIGNNWGLNINNEFFYTVGDGVNSIGDLVGPNALDIAIQRSTIGSGLTGGNSTVIVNPGSYTMTAGALSSKMKMIGNVKEGIRPIVTLNYTGGSADQAGNPTQGLGHYVSGIQFESLTAAGFQSITIVDGQGTANDRTQIVKDCRFINCGLFFQDVTETLPYKITQIIDSCYFDQDNTLANNVGFYTNGANLVLLENCIFTGYGYAAGIGGATPFVANLQKVVFNNCQFFMDDDGLSLKRITALSPLGISRYLFVNNIEADVQINNCSIKAVEALSDASVAGIVNGAQANAGDFDKFIEIIGKNVMINDSTIVGTSDTYDNGGTGYQLPTLFIEPKNSLFIDKTFVQGMLPLQVSGANAFSNTDDDKGQIRLVNSDFIGFSGDDYMTTAIDLDLPAFLPLSDFAESPTVIIDNCSLQNRRTLLAGTNTPLEHINNTAAYFTALGLLMIYAPFWNVNVSNSSVTAIMEDNVIGARVNMVNTVIDVTGSSIISGNININNSNFRLDGSQDSGNATEKMLGVLLKGGSLNFNNNYSFFTGLAGGSTTNYNSYLWLKSRYIGNVSGNNFLGTDEGFGLAVVVIDSGSTGGGMFVDNAFSHTATTPSQPTLVFEDTTGLWTIERNKNQTKTIALRGNRGRFAVGKDPTYGSISLGSPSFLSASTFIQFTDKFSLVSNGTTNFFYKLGVADIRYIWELSLDEALPENVYVISSTAALVTSGLFTATGDFTLEMFSSAQAIGTYTDTADLSVVLSDVLTVTPASPMTEFRTGTSSLWPSLILSLEADSAADRVLAIGLNVTYRW